MTKYLLTEAYRLNPELTVGWLFDTLMTQGFNLGRPFVVSLSEDRTTFVFEQPSLDELWLPGAGFINPDRQ